MLRISIEMHDNQLQKFFYWINERHKIYLKRQRGESWPWTEDKILQTYKFTNPFRENDRVTIWIRKNIREPYANSPELFFNLMLARLINWPDTLSKIGYINNWNTAYVYNILENRRVSGQKFITGAYMLTGTFGKKGTPKSWQIAYHCLEQIWEMRREITPILKDNLQSAYNRMMEKHPPGFGGFLTYEIVTDLRHTRYLENADDIMTWAHAGPGCKRGINRLYDNDVRTNCPDDFALEVMKYLLDISPEYLECHVPKLELRDIEHSLCEWDKYMRVLNGEGRPRSKFIPPHLRS